MMDRRRFLQLGAAALVVAERTCCASEATAPLLDRSGRLLALVLINGKGPFHFVVDTAADRSALSARVVNKLGLLPTHGAGIAVNGTTGRSVVPGVRISSLEAGELLLKDHELPILSPSALANADGILGVEGLANMRLDIDFVQARVTIAPSSGEPAAAGFTVLTFEPKFGGLIAVAAKVGNIDAKAIVDTGAGRTLCNRELQRRLRQIRQLSAEPLIRGATGEMGSVESGVVAQAIQLGPISQAGLPVAFGDLPVFRAWGLEATPALLAGMDLLGKTRRLIVDYKRSELHLLRL